MVERVGGHTSRRVDTRIVVATNRSLRDLALRGLFREDDFLPLPCAHPNCHQIAIAYRHENGYPHADVAMSVAVQQMVLPKAAGVAFTLNPTNGDRSTIVIDSAFGLGDFRRVDGLRLPVQSDQLLRTRHARDLERQSAPHVLPSHNAACLQGEPVSVEKRIELVKGEIRRPCPAQDEKIALPEMGLKGSDVKGLKELGLEKLADPGDLMSGQRRIGIG